MNQDQHSGSQAFWQSKIGIVIIGFLAVAEREALGQFGDDYRYYMGTTPGFFPHFSAQRPKRGVQP